MTTIRVKYVNPPKNGARSGSIKTDTSDYYGFDPAKFSFQPGRSYEVEFAETSRNGRTYRDIVAVKGGGDSGGGQAPNGGGGGDRWYMPFVSNTVAHAISADKIQGPDDIRLWAEAAKDAAEALGHDFHD